MVPFKHLVSVFTRLETQLCELYEPAPRIVPSLFQLANGRPSDTLWSISPPRFSSLHEAWIVLNHSWHSLEHFLHRGEMFVEGNTEEDHFRFMYQRNILRKTFSDWSIAFIEVKEKLRSQSKFSEQEERGAALLELHHIIAAQIIDAMKAPGDMVWDQYIEGFLQVIELSAIVVGQNQGKAPIFSLDMGIVPPLFHTLRRCRDARVRLRAVKLLEDYPRLEGLWDGALVARAGRRIDEIERQGRSLEDAAVMGESCEDIPEWARVLVVDVIFSTEARQLYLTFWKARSESDRTMVAIKETLSW